MKIALAVAVLCALALPAAALAKGPTEASIRGPGLATPLRLTWPADGRSDSPMEALVNGAGIMQVVFGTQPRRILRRPPTARLGRRYVVRYLFPRPSGPGDIVRQDLYPFAKGGPVTYTPPGQRIYGTRRALGGWFRASVRLRRALVAAGLPRTV
jgi:hypothetical protein